MAQSGSVVVDGVSLAYERYGSGRPVVLIHGFPATSFSWRQTAVELADRYDAICFDMMGFGGSDKPRGENCTVNRQAELIWGAVRQMGIERPVMVGHSLGGGVCLSILRSAPADAAAGLVLVNSVCYPQPLPWFILALRIPLLPKLGMKLLPLKWGFRAIEHRMYHPRNGMTREALDEYASSLRSPGAADALISTAKQMIPHDIDELVASYSDISVPTLVIWGKQDRVLPLRQGQRLSGQIPGALLQEIEVCGHCPQEERPEEAITLIRRFIDSID